MLCSFNIRLKTEKWYQTFEQHCNNTSIHIKSKQPKKLKECGNTKKYKKYEEVPRSTRSTEKYREVPKSTKKYQEVLGSTEVCFFLLASITVGKVFVALSFIMFSKVYFSPSAAFI
jgi:hypothetical protein